MSFGKKIVLVVLLIANLGSFAQQHPVDSVSKNKIEPEPPLIGSQFQPSIGLGTGTFSFFGDLYAKKLQPFSMSRTAYEFSLSQALNHGIQLNFYILFGKLGANERLGTRNQNFQSEIRLGGFQLQYDFSHLIPKHHQFRPWLAFGIESFEFLSKTDLKDKSGNTYHYWADGSIKNKAESDVEAANAVRIYRDYTYETDIRELNADGKGKYPERSFAIPLGAGFLFNLTDQWKLKVGTTFHITFTDEIDGISAESKGDRAGNKANDRFVMSSVSLHYTFKPLPKKNKEFSEKIDYYALMNEDEDGDGVRDFKDNCHQTPAGVKVDEHGCPVDEDNDMIADHVDQELPTPVEMIANGLGIGITDAMAQHWYDTYHDTLGKVSGIIDLDSMRKKETALDKLARERKEYTIELASFKGGVPDDVMAFLLSIGDMQSTEIGNETVVYTAGFYDDLNMAIKRKEEFIKAGLKDVKIGYFQNDKYYTMDNSEKALKNERDLSESMIAKVGVHEHGIKVDGNSVFYRVQLGAYRNALAKTFFKHTGKVVELKTEDNYHKYVTESFLTLESAMLMRAELVLDGYSDAFVTAYKNGKRISLAEAGATFVNKSDAENEVLDESKNKKGALDKNLVIYKIQIGSLKKLNDKVFEERLKALKEVQKSITPAGLMRFVYGEFHDYKLAVQEKNKLAQSGYNEAFVIATFNGDVISIQEAQEIMGETK